ncbi:HD domain-containing protein [Mycoplasmatota bacterium]|nr:HD domain-containing protein [Mycoplasmatota bacterium]
MSDLFNLDDKKKICDVKNNEKISIYAKIENLNVQQAVNQTHFLSLMLIDETGYIYAKKWNIKEEEKKLFKTGQLVFITGIGNEYNNKTQLIIDEMRLIDENDKININEFYLSSPISKEKLRINITSYIEMINNKNLKPITSTLYYKYENQYLVFPAASKNHHAYISGLAHHVSTMLDLAKSIAMSYPNINLDLLYSGIILHDIGKVIELSDYLAPEYTTVGKLIGHINICFEEIRVIANDLNIKGEEVMLLQHMILSHHGLLEYGSPKRPLILEAEVLHLIDMIDSRMNMIDSELEEINNSDFTKRIYALDGRSFYKHNLS